MRHFEHQGEICAYEIDGTQDDLIAAALFSGWTEIAQADVGELLAASAREALSVAPTPEQRVAEIDASLAAIDQKGARPSRDIALALAAGNPAPSAAVQKLNDLEAQAESLRAERRTLTT